VDFPGDVWVIGATEKGALWLAERGVEKTKAEAQAIVDGEVAKAQAAYGMHYQKTKKQI
jgi:hypothetical protein